MNIKIKDIGKIEYADIALDGITIIAGENNTGKSTIGKVVYSVFRGMGNWEQTYYEACAMGLNMTLVKAAETLENFCMEKTNAVRRRTNRVNKLIEVMSHDRDFIACVEDNKFYAHTNREETDEDVFPQLIASLSVFCESYVQIYQKDAKELINMNPKFFSNWITRTAEELIEKVEIDERILQGRVIGNSFSECFRKQYLREGSDCAHISISDNERKYEITFQALSCTLSSPIRFNKNIYFIETPKLFDEIGRYRWRLRPRDELQEIMTPNSFMNIKRSTLVTRYDDALENIIENVPEELDEILKMLREEMGGYAHFYEKSGIKFKDNSLKNPIEAQNVSTGLKAMAFLEYALRIGAIQKGDVLILDEPEINLHPEWQVSYARALVLLHKKYDLTILITSHSPYFIRAIECLSDKYDVMNNLNVYLVDKDADGKQQIDNVMESEYGMTELYDKLSAPLDSLQDEINQKYGE